MIARFFWSIVLVSTLYIIGVFFVPSESDKIADLIWARGVNTGLRSVASFFQNDLGNMVVAPLNEGSGLVRQAQDVVDATKSSFDATRQVVGQKAEQAQKVVDSVGKATNALGELQQNVSELTSFSGVSGSGTQTDATSSGASLSGNIR